MADYSWMASFGILRPHEVFTISPSQHSGRPSAVGCTLTTDRNEMPIFLESGCASRKGQSFNLHVFSFSRAHLLITQACSVVPACQCQQLATRKRLCLPTSASTNIISSLHLHNLTPSAVNHTHSHTIAPEASREMRGHHSHASKRRRSIDSQERNTNDNKRPRIYDDSAQSQRIPADPSDPSTIPLSDGRSAATAPNHGNLGNAYQGYHQSIGNGQYRVPRAPTLKVVERATVLCQPIPFSDQRQLSVLDISFGSTCQTNFCAKLDGFTNMWVAKLSCTDLCDELFRHILGEDDTRLLCSIMAGEKQSSQVVRMYSGYTGLTGFYRNTVHIIMWPQAEPGNGPSRDMNLGEEAGLREFVEMIGGCWIE
ncbi:uncharacterized protein NECHADRAFT_85223 [Fusarium vanettenii 77-13-4]|uniref:Uncharacterized protein n=1 Tax=Fusarium vanettenii (strain ATCC MYA-4622 / CBS 123669 / FGSC 9596 / NRRL 45880 / 77-13-4) TaxID=660122 RepID=C7YVC1_FUSV7|nr:uncharacterized protein NECHADRAFT_85223 [Fusarium vanettenii 77-13-4]EEU44558.1 predicted protein [Fusarium vanettenii 77-13-4]